MPQPKINLKNFAAVQQEAISNFQFSNLGPAGPTSLADLKAKLANTRDLLPPVYRVSLYDPFSAWVNQLTQQDYDNIMGNPGAKSFVFDFAQSVIQHATKYEHDATCAFQEVVSDMYDGFLDLQIKNVAENMLSEGTPKDPGVPASAIGGDAATGLDWAAGSINRVTQYSELWDELPGLSEGLYAFSSGGFYDHQTPPTDVPGVKEDPGHLPAICRYTTSPTFSAEVSLHSWLSDVPKELKRLLITAEAINRAFDLGILKAPSMAYRRGAVLVTLAGLLEFPADQNRLDAMWAIALLLLNFPEISRSTVRACITEEDHHANNYYGSRRGIRQLLGTGPNDRGALGSADPVSWNLVNSEDPQIGRARPLPIHGSMSDVVS